MSRLYCVFSNIMTMLLNKGNINLKSPTTLQMNSHSQLGKQNNDGMIFTKLKDSRNNLNSVRKVSQSSDEYSYFKAEYSHGSFLETFNGELLIPSDTVSYTKEKVR